MARPRPPARSLSCSPTSRGSSRLYGRRSHARCGPRSRTTTHCPSPRDPASHAVGRRVSRRRRGGVLRGVRRRAGCAFAALGSAEGPRRRALARRRWRDSRADGAQRSWRGRSIATTTTSRPALNRVARLLAAGRSGQTLDRRVDAHDLARDHLPPAVEMQALGVHDAQDLARAEAVFQLCTTPPSSSSSTPLRTAIRRTTARRHRSRCFRS